MARHGFHCITFGCQMNVNDTWWLARALRKRGMEETTLELADVVFVNTCAVREKPEQKVHSTLGRIRQANPFAVVGVVGCVAQQLGQNLMRRHPQVRLVAGSDGIIHTPDAFVRLLEDSDLRLSFLDFSASYPNRDPQLGVLQSGREAELGQTESCPTAFVNIMQGCDNFCAYCIVPYVRGPQRSRQISSIIEECRAWLERGARDITLLGQNVNAFGKDIFKDDFGNGVSFPDLLRMITKLPGLARLHFVTSHPRDFSEETVAIFAELPQIGWRLHLPLQSGSDRVLERMGRGYTLQKYLDLVAKLRLSKPDLALSTDLIVGFPGETEEDFQQTLVAVRAAGFVSSFSFCYSDRPGTKASAMPGKIAREVQLERLERLQALQNECSQAWLENLVGENTEVLLERVSPRQADSREEQFQGRDPWGNIVHVLSPGEAAQPGDFLAVHVTEAKKHSLLARPVNDLARGGL